MIDTHAKIYIMYSFCNPRFIYPLDNIIRQPFLLCETRLRVTICPITPKRSIDLGNGCIQAFRCSTFQNLLEVLLELCYKQQTQASWNSLYG